MKTILEVSLQEASKAPNKLDQKRKSSQYIIIKTLNIQNVKEY